MEHLETIGLIAGLISAFIAVYQWATINEIKKRGKEIQYLLAGINNSAVQKNQSWKRQIQLLGEPKDENDWKVVRAHARAADDFEDLATLVTALEGTIDTESSAIKDMMRKYKETVELNNQLQAEGLKNPLNQQKEHE
ncbi:hypothetical protein VDG1235_794 [Verrucomicrobiia bacterium DG1235]|nr:hypothetical protein VDG1235_794 [Verrucomicrobiae bacterium DG1235]